MTERCPICEAVTSAIGEKPSAFSGRCYQLRQCRTCWFSFVANPWTDFARIYDEAYYAGRGADQSVDYRFEMQHPDRTVRKYEWQGILDIVSSLVPTDEATRWMDFGCGNGGLVRHLRETVRCDALGFDDAGIAGDARNAGIPIVSSRELDALAGTFDVVTAVEVIEHVPEPLTVLRTMRMLLKPGGLCFLTTGNAAPFRQRLLDWSYVLPDVHMSFFEPSTLALALTRSGFRADFPRRPDGFDDMIRFKVLKTLRVRQSNIVERAVPWRPLARLVDRRFRVSAHPIGWAV